MSGEQPHAGGEDVVMTDADGADGDAAKCTCSSGAVATTNACAQAADNDEVAATLGALTAAAAAPDVAPAAATAAAEAARPPDPEAGDAVVEAMGGALPQDRHPVSFSLGGASPADRRRPIWVPPRGPDSEPVAGADEDAAPAAPRPSTEEVAAAERARQARHKRKLQELESALMNEGPLLGYLRKKRVQNKMADPRFKTGLFMLDYTKLPVSFIVSLYPEGFKLRRQQRESEGSSQWSPLLAYSRAASRFLKSLDAGMAIPGLGDRIPTQYIDGAIILGVEDFRDISTASGSRQAPRVHYTLLRPNTATVVSEIKTVARAASAINLKARMAQEMQAQGKAPELPRSIDLIKDGWTYEESLETEALLEHFVHPPVCLDPSTEVFTAAHIAYMSKYPTAVGCKSTDAAYRRMREGGMKAAAAVKAAGKIDQWGVPSPAMLAQLQEQQQKQRAQHQAMLLAQQQRHARGTAAQQQAWQQRARQQQLQQQQAQQPQAQQQRQMQAHTSGQLLTQQQQIQQQQLPQVHTRQVQAQVRSGQQVPMVEQQQQQQQQLLRQQVQQQQLPQQQRQRQRGGVGADKQGRALHRVEWGLPPQPQNAAGQVQAGLYPQSQQQPASQQQQQPSQQQQALLLAQHRQQQTHTKQLQVQQESQGRVQEQPAQGVPAVQGDAKQQQLQLERLRQQQTQAPHALLAQTAQMKAQQGLLTSQGTSTSPTMPGPPQQVLAPQKSSNQNSGQIANAAYARQIQQQAHQQTQAQLAATAAKISPTTGAPVQAIAGPAQAQGILNSCSAIIQLAVSLMRGSQERFDRWAGTHPERSAEVQQRLVRWSRAKALHFNPETQFAHVLALGNVRSFTLFVKPSQQHLSQTSPMDAYLAFVEATPTTSQVPRSAGKQNQPRWFSLGQLETPGASELFVRQFMQQVMARGWEVTGQEEPMARAPGVAAAQAARASQLPQHAAGGQKAGGQQPAVPHAGTQSAARQRLGGQQPSGQLPVGQQQGIGAAPQQLVQASAYRAQHGHLGESQQQTQQQMQQRQQQTQVQAHAQAKGQPHLSRQQLQLQVQTKQQQQQQQQLMQQQQMVQRQSQQQPQTQPLVRVQAEQQVHSSSPVQSPGQGATSGQQVSPDAMQAQRKQLALARQQTALAQAAQQEAQQGLAPDAPTVRPAQPTMQQAGASTGDNSAQQQQQQKRDQKQAQHLAGAANAQVMPSKAAAGGGAGGGVPVARPSAPAQLGRQTSNVMQVSAVGSLAPVSGVQAATPRPGPGQIMSKMTLTGPNAGAQLPPTQNVQMPVSTAGARDATEAGSAGASGVAAGPAGTAAGAAGVAAAVVTDSAAGTLGNTAGSTSPGQNK